MPLSAKRIEKLRHIVGRYRDGGDGGVRGLYLSVPYKKGKSGDRSKPGGASWILRYDVECETRTTKNGNETNRRERWIGLGSLSDFGLKEARERARAKRQLLADHIDPLEHKAAAKTAKALAASKNITFKKASEQYLDQNEGKWTNAKHKLQWAYTLETFAYPVIGNLPVADIDTGAVLRVLEQKHPDYPDQRLWTAIPETASRLRGRIEKILAWAKTRGFRTGDNPASWKNHLDTVLSARGGQEHHPALPYSENNPRYPYAPRGIASFIVELRKQKGIAARALELLVLTATRTGAVTGMRWDEVDIPGKVWIVPPHRVGTKTDPKNKDPQPRYIPLSSRAIVILESLHTEEDNPFVFIGSEAGKGLPDRAMSKLMTDMAFNSTKSGRLAVPHGCRSTFTDWARDTTNYPDSVADQALWHAAGDATDVAYRRSDLYLKRVRLMEDWARYVGTPPAEKSAKVVPIRKRGV
jgi:integrase